LSALGSLGMGLGLLGLSLLASDNAKPLVQVTGSKAARFLCIAVLVACHSLSWGGDGKGDRDRTRATGVQWLAECVVIGSYLSLVGVMGHSFVFGVYGGMCVAAFCFSLAFLSAKKPDQAVRDEIGYAGRKRWQGRGESKDTYGRSILGRSSTIVSAHDRVFGVGPGAHIRSRADLSAEQMTVGSSFDAVRGSFDEAAE
jgi:hypothetical protein